MPTKQVSKQCLKETGVVNKRTPTFNSYSLESWERKTCSVELPRSYWPAGMSLGELSMVLSGLVLTCHSNGL